MTYSPLFFDKQSSGSSRQTVTNYVNGYGFTLDKATPVSVNSSGFIVPVDPSDETSVQSIVGLTNSVLPVGSLGGVTDNGRLENITTSFAIGDVLYIGINGLLINQKPDIGVAGFSSGDFVILVGVVVKNEFNASLKDIKLTLINVGQL